MRVAVCLFRLQKAAARATVAASRSCLRPERDVSTRGRPHSCPHSYTGNHDGDRHLRIASAVGNDFTHAEVGLAICGYKRIDQDDSLHVDSSISGSARVTAIREVNFSATLQHAEYEKACERPFAAARAATTA
jgi:hypothetical protein